MPVKHGSFHKPDGIDPITGLSLGFFGDGSDGSVSITANTNLTRDMYYDDLYIIGAVTLNPSGYRIFVKGKLVIGATGKIARNGNIGVAGVGGAALADGSIGGSKAGGNFQVAGTSEANYGIGGDGGAGVGVGAGAGGTNVLGPTYGGFRAPPRCVELHWAGNRYTGGAGGGGGNAGGGGSGGGVLVIIAKELEVNGDIEALGGDGETDGGGGGGGVIVIIYSEKSGSGDITVAGGTAAGGATDGVDGTLVQLQI